VWYPSQLTPVHYFEAHSAGLPVRALTHAPPWILPAP
jgi:hypothetical protein